MAVHTFEWIDRRDGVTWTISVETGTFVTSGTVRIELESRRGRYPMKSPIHPRPQDDCTLESLVDVAIELREGR